MRLLQYSENGKLSIHDFSDGNTPPYAILSHTWGRDGDEVTFADLQTGHGKTKPGYKKIFFCGRQAQRDNLRYFWMDTCCIDKANKAELALAIRSMFRWYRNAARCYVCLSDVSASPFSAEGVANSSLWDSEFRRSRWFTRGWTLQDLVAPSVVEFFSRDGHKLGDRASLKIQIHEVTTIPYKVLEGTPLSDISVDERLRWNQYRHTPREEDAVYSLSGIVDVEMAPRYGEGAQEAFRRLHDEIRKREECLRDLCPTDPRNDKKRIEDTTGGLLEGSYRWVLDNSGFQQWHNDPMSRLLWIKGDPGKGKTMLLCGIINELQKMVAKTTSVSYFFCQRADSRINSATAVLRGLLHLLVSQQPALTTHIRKRYDQAGKAVFEDANAWFALTEIFADVLQDPNLDTTYILIDALDECAIDLSKLLHFVALQSSASSRVKWIVSSRNWPGIKEELERVEHKMRLSLELNAESVAAAVDNFIKQRVDQISQEKQYEPGVRSAILQYLTSNVDGTFVWVASVCHDLAATPKWNVLQKLQESMQQREKMLGADHDHTLASKKLLRKMIPAKVPSASQQLGDFFADGSQRQKAYTDSDIQHVSCLLGQINLQWSKVPRTYIVLRYVGCLELLDTFIDLGVTDLWFPFTEQSLPPCVRPSMRSQFVATQNLVMTKSVDLEKGEKGRHCYFRANEPLPLEIKGLLGSGGFGQVDRVLSTVSYREYALKRVLRSGVFSGAPSSRRKAECVRQFAAEMKVLKRLRHCHVVEFVGSYTDTKYMGLLMSPVADMDLSGYLDRTDITTDQELRTFFGCLVRALEFLHGQHIRHKDIKPSNILVHRGNVLYTDFGLAFDFTDKNGSTTVSMVNGMTPRYCAPEVADHEPRNTSSDVWSLGVVFLEMVMVLKGRKVRDMYSFLQEHGTGQSYVRTNLAGADALVVELEATGDGTDNVVLGWVQDMIRAQQQLRPTAASLIRSILGPRAGEEWSEKKAFCGICCAAPDDDHDDMLSDFDELEISRNQLIRI